MICYIVKNVKFKLRNCEKKVDQYDVFETQVLSEVSNV